MTLAPVPAAPAIPPALILIGSRSRAAAAIRAAMTGAKPFGIGRGGGPAEAVTPDYAQVPAGVPFAGAVVVNCVGTDRGAPALLDHLNRKVPAAWAAAARAGGARQFVQVSSFSVYEPTPIVDRDSAIGPVTAYGRSKSAAERELAGLEGEDFAVALLRVPILVGWGAGANDKLAALLGAVRKTHLVPRVSPPVRRAMLTYQGLGAAVALAVARGSRGVLSAADPEPFTYEMVAQCAAEAGRAVFRLPLPRGLVALVDRAAPAVSRRLFESMELAADANILAHERFAGTLRQAVTNQLATGDR